MGELKAIGEKKPASLFEHILMQTHNMSVSHKKIYNSPLECSMKEETKLVRDSKSVVVTDNAKIFDAKEMIEFILSKKFDASERRERLKSLTKQCSESASLFEYIMPESLLTYCESLLSIYCDPFSRDVEELRMLVPLLSLVSMYSNYVESKKFETVFLRHSDFMYQLMRASVTCVTVFLSKAKELLKITWKKKLAGRVRRVGKEDSQKILTHALGIPDFPTNGFQASYADGLQMESFWLSLFDTTTGLTDKDINQHLTRMQLPLLPDQYFGSECAVNISSVLNRYETKKEREEIWSDVVVAHVLPFGGLVTYMKGDWKHWLNLINGELIEFLRFKGEKDYQANEQVNEIKVGGVVGFWSADVTFKWKPIMMMQCLRGIVLGRASHGLLGGGEGVSWAIWAMDVGSLVFCKKVWCLQNSLNSVPPLTSICSLDVEKKGNDKEETQFLLVALPLLAKLLANNPSAGRHMVAYGAGNYESGCDGIPVNDKACEGGAILMLIEYPDIATRIAFLKLILSLTRNSMEILRYLQECRFDLALSSRLEVCVHFCNAVSSDGSFWMEIRLLILVLTSMADGSDVNMTELPGWNYIQRILIMLTEIDNHPRVRFMAAKCLASLESHKITKTRVDPIMAHRSPDRSMAKKCIVERPSDVVGGSIAIINKTKKVSQWADGQLSKNKDCNFSNGNKNMDSILAAQDFTEPVLSVMDVGDSSSDEEFVHLPSINAVTDMTSRVDYYTKGYKVNICNDETHELSLEKTAHQVSENSLAKTICGFLNNGVGGSVYFGINSKSMIEGLKLSRIERDNFRKGIDRMMSRSLFPEVRPACYDVNYVPVLNAGEKSKALASHKSWIVELHIKALPHVIYTLASNRKCYVRQGSESVEAVSISMRQEAAEQNKKEIIQAIEEVKAQIPPNKDKLLVFIQDYLNRSQSSGSNFTGKSTTVGILP